MNSQSLINLPFEIQLTLAMGYIGYRIFSGGLDKKHKSYDTVFQVLFFGLPTYSILQLLPELSDDWKRLIQILSSFAATTIVAFAIRKVLPPIRKILQSLKVTSENFYPSTWTSLIYSEGMEYNIIAVRLSDGTWLESDLRKLPKNIPHYPCDFDAEGNVAFYVTEVTKPDGEVEEKDIENVCASDAGAGITYIPANQISRAMVTMRLK